MTENYEVFNNRQLYNNLLIVIICLWGGMSSTLRQKNLDFKVLMLERLENGRDSGVGEWRECLAYN